MSTETQQPTWQDIFEASIRTIGLIGGSAAAANSITSALIYELLDRYGLTKAQLRPILEEYDIEFPEQVVCVTCNEYDEDTQIDNEQQPHVYYEECPYCEKYFHNDTFAYKTKLPCKGHQHKCRLQEDGED